MAQKSIATKILPNIWIGDKKAASSPQFFKECKIGAVINMTPSITNYYCDNEKIEYLRIPVYDSVLKRDTEKMYNYFPVICEFIHKNAIIENKNVLIHCHQGKQRSAAAAAAFIIKFYKMSPSDAIKHIINQRSNAFHSGECVNFAMSLNKWFYKTQKMRMQKEKIA